jgi:spore germination cell wall hydrolase CwlJ-like protein
MQKRFYIVISLFLITLLIFIIALVPKTKIIEINYSQLTKEGKAQVDCLAENIYHEAAYEPINGRIAVALVTMNRVNDPRYPNNICSVVKQRIKYTCQFSWYCERNKHIRNYNAYLEAQRIALHVYANYESLKDLTGGALFYHADYVQPNWRNLQKTAVIGRHIFYKERNPL